MSTPLHLACCTYIRTHPDWTMEVLHWPLGADWDDMIAAERQVYRERRMFDEQIEKRLAEYDRHNSPVGRIMPLPVFAILVSIAIAAVMVTIVLLTRWALS